MTKRTYRSMQGKEIDMESLKAKNELAIAVGNVRMNARGDQLGPSGKIIKRREETSAEYYENNTKPTRRGLAKPATTHQPAVVETEPQPVVQKPEVPSQKVEKVIEEEIIEPTEEKIQSSDYQEKIVTINSEGKKK